MNREPLDQRIRVIVNQLVEAAPPAPPFPERIRFERFHRRKRWALVVIPVVFGLVATAAAAVIPALVETSPGVTRLFIRSPQAGLVIRGYLFSQGGSPPSFRGELSLPRAVGGLYALSEPVGAREVRAVQTTVFGSGSTEAEAVAVQTGANVTSVAADVNGRADSMRPVDGWAVLAWSGQPFDGRIRAYDDKGHLLTSIAIPKPSRSGESLPGESVATFVRVTNQNVLIIGHTVRGSGSNTLWLYPYLADHDAVQQGLEGIPSCRPNNPRALIIGATVAGGAEGGPMTVVIVHAGRSISKVSIAYANGANDAMNTIDGQAILVTLGTASLTLPVYSSMRATVSGFSASGGLVARTILEPVSSPYNGCS